MARKASDPAKFGRTYLREWRKKHGWTLDEVVGRIETYAGDGPDADPALKVPRTTASLSRIENGKQPYTQPVLEVLADIYGTTPGELISTNPLMAGEVIDITKHLREASDAQLKQISAIVDAVMRTA